MAEKNDKGKKQKPEGLDPNDAHRQDPGSIFRAANNGKPLGGKPKPVGEVSDDSLAQAFTAMHQDDWRYVAAWGQWLRWTGVKWEHETTLRAFDLARELCRIVATQLRSQGLKGKGVASAVTVSAVERLARADRAHAMTSEAWDKSPWHLNTPGGVIDLKSGQLLPHDPAMLITKETAATPQGQCPRWLQFLDEISGGDRDLQDYLQRVVGYCLTGVTTEHVMFFLYGTGANGKSVFTSTLSGIFGEFTTVAPMDMLIATQGERHPTDMAGLRGARMVTAIETEQGTRWAEAKLKALTGGDPISARFMRQDFFQYVPQFKLMVAGNHKPSMRSNDEAIRRRVQLVPFAVTIPEAQRDPDLLDKLKAEWSGILQWALVGCLMWQAVGLKPPQVVKDATIDYFVSEDAVGQWIEDECELGKPCFESSKQLYNSWKAWAENNGEFVMSKKRLANDLVSRFGCKLVRTSTERQIRGIKLRWGLTS